VQALTKDIHVVKEVEIPAEVEVKINGAKVIVKGPRGSLERDFSHAKGIIMSVKDDKFVVEAYFANARKRALVGTVAAHVKNMITGVMKGFRYKLKIIYSHFPITANVKDDKVIITNFLGEKSPRVANVMPGVKVKVQGQDIIIEGTDIEKVAQTAANIERATKIKDLDRRKFMDGIYIYEREVIE